VSPGPLDLQTLVAGVRRHLVRRSWVAAATWMVTGCAVVWLFAWWSAGGAGWRSGSRIPLVIDAMVFLWVCVGILALRRTLERVLAEERVARAIEEASALRQGDVLGPLELAREVPAGVSRALADRASRSAADRLRGRPPAVLAGALGNEVHRWTKRGWGALVVATVAVLALTVLTPDRSAQVWRGLASPLAVLMGPGLPPLDVWPGDVEVMRGSDLEVRVVAPGRRTVELRWQGVGDVAHTERTDVVDGQARFSLRTLSVRTEYTVHGDDGAVSPRYRVEPFDPLFVSDLRIELDFPPHTGLAPEEFRGGVPDLRIPVGTRFTFEGRANRPLASARLVDSMGVAAAELVTRAGGFGGAWTPESSGRYVWNLRDGSGAVPEVLPEPVRVALVADARPVVDISVPGEDADLTADLRQQLLIEAADDYGLRVLEMSAYRVTATGERREPVTQRFDLGGTRVVSAAPVLDFASWGLMPGDEVRYLARVQDNAPVGQWAETSEYVLRMPSAADLRRGVEASLEEAAARLAELVARTAEQAERNREEARRRSLNRAGRPGNEPGQGSGERDFQEREGLQQALDAQRETMGTLDALSAELAALERRMAEAGLADPALREQMQALQQLLAELGSDALQQSMEQLSEALNRGDNAAAGRSLDQLSSEQESLRDRLESSLERFRRAAVEQGFRATRSDATELARQERALADAFREDGGTAQRTAQQSALADRAAELEERLGRLEDQLRELGEEGAANRVTQASAQADEARTGMQQAASEAQQGRAEEAARRAEAASSQLDQAAGQLDQAQQEMAGQQMDRLLETLERTAYDALALARRQTELGEAMRGATAETLQGLRVDEASLAQGVANIADNLQQGAGGEVPGGREISAAIGRALESIDRTLAFMERPRSMGGSPVTEAERVVADLNRLAVITLRIVDQLGQMGQGSTRDGPPMQQALENLAQQQGDLVNQAGQIMPMELGDQALAEQLQQLAEEQQAVSDQLGDLASDPDADGALGDLDQLATEAAELAEALAEGRLDAETVRRQEQLFHRLLDAGRSLEREEFSEEREAEVGSAVERGTVLPLEGGHMGVMRYEMPSAAELQELTPGLRRLILDYFERLNRGPAPSEGGGR